MTAPANLNIQQAASSVRVERLTIEGATFAFGSQPVVKNVRAEIHAGELVAIVGPNGCGKSTLLRLLVGELSPAQGSISIDGVPLNEFPRREMAQRIALVPQQATTAFAYTVREMVLMARYAAHGAAGGFTSLGFETPADLQLANEAMWLMDVHSLADRPVSSLSGGERQRVTIARALAQQTPVLLLDEPTSALDMYHQLELWAHLRELVQTHRRLVVMVTHDLNVALTQATRALVMDRGAIIADGPPTDVLTPTILQQVYHVNAEHREGVLRFTRMTEHA